MPKEGREFKSGFNDKYNLVSRKMMRMLSENSRITISDLARNLGLSRKTAKERLNRLEKEFEIRYTVELNEDKLGIVNPHIIMVKFRKRPTDAYLKEVFSKFYMPQVVVTIKGTYDMFVYANAQSRDDYVHWDKGMQIFLADYGVSWNPSEVALRQLGFYPVRNELIERLNLPPKYKTLLMLLNKNARASFQELSKQTGMHFNKISYYFKKLVELGYIKRFTLVMKKVEDLTLMTIFGKYIISSRFEEDAKSTRDFFKSDDEYSLVSRYIIVNQLVGSHDHFSIGVFDNLETATERFWKYYKEDMRPEKPKSVYGVVDKVLLGDLPIRSLNTDKEYKTIKWPLELLQK